MNFDWEVFMAEKRREASKFKFKPTDFSLFLDCESTAREANAALEARLATCTRVYARLDFDRQWIVPLTENSIPIGSTHTALLFNVEEIAKEPCKHEAVGPWREGYSVYDCKHCGIALKATWSPAND